MSILLIGGGSRSGKSRYALTLAERFGSRKGFLATAQAFDEEMEDRIRCHQRERDTAFMTIEEPFEVGSAVRHAEARFDVVVVDCLTLWLTNMLLAGRVEEMDAMLTEIEASPVPCILVTNEVGCGIVPENALARRFRDLAGSFNQKAAIRAIEVYWMVFGIAMKIK